MTFLKKHKNDILLVFAVLILAGGFWLYSSFAMDKGGEAVVSVDGEELCRLPLGADTTYTIGEGEHFNILVISGGEAWMLDASCPDHICVNSGKVSLEGQSIVCLPNKTIVSIVGGEDSGLDGVAG